MMQALQNIPENCRIRVQHDPNGLLLTWRLRESRARNRLDKAFIYALSIVTVVGTFLLAREAIIEGVFGIAVAIIIWGLVMAFFLRKSLIRLSEPDRDESVFLQPDRIVYDPGQAISLAHGNYLVPHGFKYVKRFFLRDAVPLDLLRDEIKGFAIDVQNGYVRLYFWLGRQRVEIAEVLATPEKEWLLAVLREWQANTSLLEASV
jgi:hypothetical protein